MLIFNLVRNLLLLQAALLLLPLGPLKAAAPVSIHYFDHEYRVSFGGAGAMERIAGSTSTVKLERVVSTITYTNGARFVIEAPDNLKPEDLLATTDYEFEERLDVLDGGNSLIMPPRRIGETPAADNAEAMAAALGADLVPAEIHTGVSPSGLRFKVLYVPTRREERLWIPTAKMEHRLSVNGSRAVFTSIALPMGLENPSADTVEEASHKEANVLLSIGAGGAVIGEEAHDELNDMLNFLTAAGTDITALDYRDLRNFWRKTTDGGIKLSLSSPDFICSNAGITDPELARIIKPYALRRLSGRTVAFIALTPYGPEAKADLAGGPFAPWDPKDEDALYALVTELREKQKADIIVAVSFFRREDFGWLMNAPGIDIVIGPKNWDSAAPLKTRVELANWDKSLHRGPALVVYPDPGGAGRINLEFGHKGRLEAAESLPAPAGDGGVFEPEARAALKEMVIKRSMGSGDTLLPDPRNMAIGGRTPSPFYAIQDFFNMSAGILRKKLKAEIAVLRITPSGSSVLGDTPSSIVRLWLGPDEPVALALLPGSLIRGFFSKTPPPMNQSAYYSLRAYQGQDYYAVSGLDGDGRVAGLPLNDSELYLTALPLSLLQGRNGFQHLPAQGGTLHSLIIDELRAIKKAAPKREDWENGVRSAIAGPPERRDVWRINLRNLSMKMVNINVDGPSGFASAGESRLSADAQTLIQGSGKVVSEYYSGRFRFDAGVAADYGKTTLRPRNAPKTTSESVDQLVYSAELVYRMKSYNGKLGSVVLGPYASTAYETEFSRNPGYNLKKVLRGSAGYKLFEGALLQELYAGVTTENIQTYSPARTQYALETGFRFASPIPGTALTLCADGTYRSFARSRYDTAYALRDRLELNFKVTTRLYGDIRISPFVSYFLANGKRLSGSAYNLTTGFALEYSRLFKVKR